MANDNEPRCPTCGGNLTLLLFSRVCDTCDNRTATAPAQWEAGYIVWRSRPPGSCEYLFQTEEGAISWRDKADLTKWPIRKVGTTASLQWRQMGAVPGVYVAGLFEVYHSKLAFDRNPHKDSRAAYLVDPITY